MSGEKWDLPTGVGFEGVRRLPRKTRPRSWESGKPRVFTQTHQAIADVSRFGGGLVVAEKLARANIITNKNLLPQDRPSDWDRPGGLRMGTIEVTRLGMMAQDMEIIADFIARILVEKIDPEDVVAEVTDFRSPFQKLFYSFEAGLPPAWCSEPSGTP
jgi:glycine hydroxymethyltransferase